MQAIMAVTMEKLLMNGRKSSGTMFQKHLPSY